MDSGSWGSGEGTTGSGSNDDSHQETALGIKLTKDKCQNVLNLLQLSLLRTDRLTHSNLVQMTLYQ